MFAFIPDWPTLAAYIVASTILTLTPGPDMTLFLSRSLAQGRAAGLACMSGALTGVAIHTTLVAVGLSALIVAAPVAFMALKVVGAGYLVWLAIDAIRNGSSLTLKSEKQKPKSLRANYLTGLGINLLNPKIILFFMTFLPQFVAAGDPHATGKLFFLGAMFIVVAVPIVVPMILTADRLAIALAKSRIFTRIMDWSIAGIFGAFAVKILATSGR
jgi:threonine/homoserine/homoserine lactone efflux protein